MSVPFITAISACVTILHAQDWSAGSFSPEPNPIHRISQAVINSKIDELTPKSSVQEDQSYSYHLRSVRYLGGISREAQHFMVASVHFIRSSPKGSEMPPARGHGFLLLLDQEYRLATYCRIDFPDQIELLGGKLFRLGKLPFESENAEIGDLGAKDVSTRTHGFLIDGDAFLSYPFSDRIEQPEDTGNRGDKQGGGAHTNTCTEPK
jgi:hypothetical protein